MPKNTDETQSNIKVVSDLILQYYQESKDGIVESDIRDTFSGRDLFGLSEEQKVEAILGARKKGKDALENDDSSKGYEDYLSLVADAVGVKELLLSKVYEDITKQQDNTSLTDERQSLWSNDVITIASVALIDPTLTNSKQKCEAISKVLNYLGAAGPDGELAKNPKLLEREMKKSLNALGMWGRVKHEANKLFNSRAYKQMEKSLGVRIRWRS
jgi:hypothetical protein